MSKYKQWRHYYSASEIYDCYFQEKEAVFLDSSLENVYGQYSIIGLHPYLKVESRKGKLFINDTAHEGTFASFLGGYLQKHYETNPTPLPLFTGAIGYLSYDFGMMTHQIVSCHPQAVELPEALFIFYEHYVIEDLKNKKIYLIADGHLINDEASLAALERDLEKRLESKRGSIVACSNKKGTMKVVSDFEKDQYLDAISKVIDYIIEGDIYIANLTRQLFIESSVPPYKVYQKLRRNNPAPFGAYLNYGDFQVVCSSPERFLKLTQGKLETRPIKGTRKRGKTREEDEKLRTELLNSAKDKSELLMIVDLERNDLNKVCEAGSVEVSELFTIEAYATVFHLVSTVTGKLKKEMTALDLLLAMFPGGSITGAPKRRAMEIIDELEHSRRGLYTGSIGYLALDNTCDFNIVIRTAIYQNGVYHLGVGGGITYESELQFEFEETEQKAKALLEAMQ